MRKSKTKQTLSLLLACMLVLNTFAPSLSAAELQPADAPTMDEAELQPADTQTAEEVQDEILDGSAWEVIPDEPEGAPEEPGSGNEGSGGSFETADNFLLDMEVVSEPGDASFGDGQGEAGNLAPARYPEAAASLERLLPAGYGDPDGTICLGDIFYDPEGAPLSYSVSVDGAEYVPAATDESGRYAFPDALFTPGSVHTFTFAASDGLAQSADTCAVTVRGAYVQRIVYENGDDDDPYNDADVLVLSAYPVLSGGASAGSAEGQVALKAALDPSTPADAEIRLHFRHGTEPYSTEAFTAADAERYAALLEDGTLKVSPAYRITLAGGRALATAYRYAEGFSAVKELTIELETGLPEEDPEAAVTETQTAPEMQEGADAPAEDLPEAEESEEEPAQPEATVIDADSEDSPAAEAGEDVPPELISADEPMAIASPEDGDSHIQLRFADESGAAPEGLVFTGVYESDANTLSKRTEPYPILITENAPNVDAYYSYQRWKDKKASYLYVTVPTDQYEILSWDITYSGSSVTKGNGIVKDKVEKYNEPQSKENYNTATTTITSQSGAMSFGQNEYKNVCTFRFWNRGAKFAMPDVDVTVHVKKRPEQPVVMTANPAEDAETRIPAGKLSFAFRSEAGGDEEWQGVSQGDGSLRISVPPSDIPDEPCTLMASLENLTNGDDVYRLVDWQIADAYDPDAEPSYKSVNKILATGWFGDDPFSSWKYAYEIVPESGALIIHIPDKLSVRNVVVRPVVRLEALIFTANPAEDSAEKLPDGTLSLMLKGDAEEGEGTRGQEQEDKSLRLSCALAKLPEGPSTITAKMENLTWQDGEEEQEYRVADWQIADAWGSAGVSYRSVNAILAGDEENPFAEYTYEIDPVNGILAVHVPGRESASLAEVCVRPVLRLTTGGYTIPVTTSPEAAGLRLVKYQVGQSASLSDAYLPAQGGREATIRYSTEDIYGGGLLGWKVTVDEEYYKDAYENRSFSVLENGKVYRTAGDKDTWLYFDDADNGWTTGNERGSIGFGYFYNILKTKYDSSAISAAFTAEKRDVPISFAQDRREADAKVSYTLKKGGETVAAGDGVALTGTEKQKVFTLLAKGEASDAQKEAALDTEADYELTVRLDGYNTAYDFRGWAINGAEEFSALGYPEPFQASVSEDRALTITAPGAYLPILEIGALFNSTEQVKCSAAAPEGNPEILYYMYLEDAESGKRLETLMGGSPEGSGYIERSFIQAGGSYRLRVEALRSGMKAGSSPTAGILGADYLCGWQFGEGLKTLAEANGWSLQQILSPGYSYGYETAVLEFDGDSFLAFLDQAKEAHAEDGIAGDWEFRVLTDQINASDTPAHKVVVSTRDKDKALGTAAAEFVENTVLDGSQASVWNLKVTMLDVKKGLTGWSRKAGDSFPAEVEAGSAYQYRYQVTVTEDAEYQAVFGELPFSFTGEYMGTFPVDASYIGYSDSEWYRLSEIENGIGVTSKPQYIMENSVAMEAYGPAALLFQMDMPDMPNPGCDITFRFYSGKEAAGEPFKECTTTCIGNSGPKRYLVGVDVLPDTEYVTAEAESKDGRTAQKVYLLYRRPKTDGAEKGTYSEQLRQVYETGLKKIREAHSKGTEKTYTYSSEYVMLRYEYQKAVAAIAVLDAEAAGARFEKEKQILESIGDGVIPEDVGIRVSGFSQVVAMPEGCTIENAMCALMEKANPGGWKFEVYRSPFGSWVNAAEANPKASDGTGEKTEASQQMGRWQYRIRGYNKDKKIYQEYAPLGVSSMIMLDGDFVTAGVGEQEWAFQCLGICRGAEAEAAARSAGMTVEAMAQAYGVSADKLRQAPFPEPIRLWIDAINDITPVELGGSGGMSFNEGAIQDTTEVAMKLRKAENLHPTGIYMERMSNSEWGKAFSKMKSLYEAKASGKLEALDTDASGKLTNVLNYLAANEDGSFGSEWGLLALARGGRLTKDGSLAKAWLASLDAKLADGSFDSLGSAGAGGLGGYTEYERVALALTALGIDASRYEANGRTYDFIGKILDYRSVTAQGLNAVDFALLALDSGHYDYGNAEIRQRYVEYILAYALPGGGWNLDGLGDADADMTAMTIQALVPYRNDGAVKAAIDGGLAALKAGQDGLYGDFGYNGSVNSESTAQALTALSALGIDGVNGAGWTTEYGGSVVAGLLKYYVAIDGRTDMGAFAHADGGGIDAMATEQAAYALVAYSRFSNGAKSLYDMTDVMTSDSTHAYKVTAVSGGHGSVTADQAQAVPGAYVTVTAAADSGYVLASLSLDGTALAAKDGKVSFLMPCHDVTVTAAFTGSGTGGGDAEQDVPELPPEQDVPELPPEAYYKPFITLNASSLTMQKGQITTAFKVTGLASGDSVKSWKSGNTKVLTAAKYGKLGVKLRAKKTGTVKLTVTTAMGASKTVTVKVQKAKVTTRKVTVSSGKKLTLEKGKKAKLKAKTVLTPITSQDKVTYTSSNPKVAVVGKTNGVVTAKKPGTAKITVKAGKKKYVVTVTVPKRIVGVSSSVTLKRGKTKTLKPALNTGAKVKFTYKSSNAKIVSVTKNGKLKAKKKGTATITIRYGKLTKKVKVTVR